MVQAEAEPHLTEEEIGALPCVSGKKIGEKICGKFVGCQKSVCFFDAVFPIALHASFSNHVF